MLKLNKKRLDAILEKKGMSYFDLGAWLYPKRPVDRQRKYIGVLFYRTISVNMATRIMNALNVFSYLSFCDKVSCESSIQKLDTTEKRTCVGCGCSFTPFEEGEGIIACRGWGYCSIQCLDKEFSERPMFGRSKAKIIEKRRKKNLSLRDRSCGNE